MLTYSAATDKKSTKERKEDNSAPDEINIQIIINFSMYGFATARKLTPRQKSSMFHETQLDRRDLRGAQKNSVHLITSNFSAFIKGSACKLIKFRLGQVLI